MALPTQAHQSLSDSNIGSCVSPERQRRNWRELGQHEEIVSKDACPNDGSPGCGSAAH